MAEDRRHVWGIILAGGEGKRLQPFIHSRFGIDTPKQFCTFTGTRSMLRHTIDRAELLIPPERLLTIVSRRHMYYAEQQLADRVSETVIVQSFNRETGPAILYPLLHVYLRDPEAVVCLFPSDHFILNEQRFMNHIAFSSSFVTDHDGSVVLLGVDPVHPEREYGWIVTGDPVADSNEKEIYRVSQFVEKPDAFTASQLYRKGSLWNTMVIVSKAQTLLESFKNYTPSVYREFWNAREVLGSSREQFAIEKVYSNIPPVNFSESILGKRPVGLHAIKLQGVTWSDWGDAARIQRDIQLYCNTPSADSLQYSVGKTMEV